MPTVKLMPPPIVQFFDASGIPLADGKLYTWEPGQPGVWKDTYTDSTGTTKNTVSGLPDYPHVVLDSAGRASVWLDGYYDISVSDKNGVSQWSQNNVSAMMSTNTEYFVSDYDDLDDAITSIGSTNVNLHINATTTAGTLAVPENIRLIMDPGGLISIPDGVTLTINSSFTAGLVNCFDCNDTGLVVFGDSSVTQVYPEWFGAVADGVTDCTSAFVKTVESLPASGGVIKLGDGAYLISSVTLSKPTLLIGNGPSATTIKAVDATSNVIIFDVAYCQIEKVGFRSNVTRTGGAYVSVTKNCSRSRIRDFVMVAPYIGISCVCANSIWIDTGDIYNTVADGVGIQFIGDGVTNGGNDLYVNKVTMSGDVNIAAAGILITNNGAINITDCDIIRHGSGMRITPGNGEVATAIYVNNSYFDTSTYGVWIEPAIGGTVQGVRFANCWLGSQSAYGLVCGSTGFITGIELISCHVSDNANGILLSGGSDFKMIGGYLSAKTNLTGTGLIVGANVSTWSLLGVRIGDGYGKYAYQYGVYVAAGSSDNYSIIGCNFNGTTTPISDAGTGTNKQIFGNFGSGSNGAYTYLISGTTYTVGADTHITVNTSSTMTLTLPNAASYLNRTIRVRSVYSAVASNAANVVPLAGGAATTSIVSTAGKWVDLVSDGTYWQIFAAN